MSDLETSAELWDIGGLDWLVYEDDKGRLWFRPALSLSDGQVYEHRSSFGHDIYHIYDEHE